MQKRAQAQQPAIMDSTSPRFPISSTLMPTAHPPTSVPYTSTNNSLVTNGRASATGSTFSMANLASRMPAPTSPPTTIRPPSNAIAMVAAMGQYLPREGGANFATRSLPSTWTGKTDDNGNEPLAKVAKTLPAEEKMARVLKMQASWNMPFMSLPMPPLPMSQGPPLLQPPSQPPFHEGRVGEGAAQGSDGSMSVDVSATTPSLDFTRSTSSSSPFSSSHGTTVEPTNASVVMTAAATSSGSQWTEDSKQSPRFKLQTSTTKRGWQIGDEFFTVGAIDGQ